MRFLWVFIFALSVGSLSSQEANDSSEIIETDSTQYELIITEPGFESWFVTNRKPEWWHEHIYYRQHNQLYANEWNDRVRQFKYDRPYDFLIHYDPTINYGIDLDFKLYWYFKFMEDKYNIDLILSDRKN
ncbi:MAG: hypothetical protein KDC05_14875 [Bacteroidales bacterium]|nr:hypothetical protein [Bacteroidales bacterium]